MIAKVSKELADAVDASDHGLVKGINPETNKVYVVVDGELHPDAEDVLRRQKDHDAIAEGIRQMEAGEGRPVEESFEAMRQKLGFPAQQ